MSDILRQWLREVGIYIFGVVTGATVMIYVHEQPQVTRPVVTVEQDGAQAGKEAEHAPVRSDAAPPPTQAKADEVRHLQRVKELRVSLEKLERMKAVHDAFLKQAAVKRDDIQQMVKVLGGT